MSTGSVILVPASPPASAPNSLGPSVAPRGIASPPAPEAAEVSTGSVISVPASPPASAPNSLGPSVAPRGIASPPAPEAAEVSTGSVISVPASPPASAPNSLGPSVASRGIASPPESSPPWGPGLAPPIREPSAPELSPRQPPPANVGSTAAGQPPYRSGYSESLRNRGPAETAEGALLGVAGIFIMTASGVFIGYWLARAGYVGRTHGAIRFLR